MTPARCSLDIATAVPLGGDCLADLAVVRAQPELFGPVASDPTVSRVIAKLAADINASLPAIRNARARARASIWGRQSPLRSTAGGSDKDSGRVVVDLDARW